jgi:hypothetical protein
LATFTSQRLSFRALPLHQRPLMRGMVLSALVAALVSSIGSPMQRSLRELGAFRAAVDLPSVVRPADEERRRASPAAQLEDNELVHPVRIDETGQRLQDPSQYAGTAVHPPAVHEGPGANLDPPSFHTAVRTYKSGWCRTSFLNSTTSE